MTRRSFNPVGRYLLTTAEILYRLPDHPHLVQTFVWQTVDRAPDFPLLRRFLQFWQREIEGKLHQVRVATRDLAGGGEWRFAPVEWRWH